MANCRSLEDSALKSQRTREPLWRSTCASAFDHSTGASPSGLLLLVSLILPSGSDEAGPHIGVIMRSCCPLLPSPAGSTTRNRRWPFRLLGFTLPSRG